MVSKIKVDISELAERLEEMQEDGYITIQLSIIGDTYTKELKLEAYSIEDGGNIDYGSVPEESEEIIF